MDGISTTIITPQYAMSVASMTKDGGNYPRSIMAVITLMGQTMDAVKMDAEQ